LKIVKGVVIATGFTAALGVAAPGFAGGNKYASVSDSQVCTGMDGKADHVNFVGPDTLWPPNHKFVDESVTALADTASENVSITVTPVVTDAVGGDGGAQHDPDYTPGGSPSAMGAGSATVDYALRSERSGRGDGRTYTITWKASFDNGANTCSSDDGKEGHHPFVVTVPHDMRNKNS
jgi:hypothetical protein